MIASMGSVKDYTLKQYLAFAEKLQMKAKVCNTSLPVRYLKRNAVAILICCPIQ